ncbi:MAG: FtsX-like permease family protein [Salibacteraceae bacterium]
MINVISGIAATGVAVGCLAMIIVLSAFNGLEALVSDLYTSVDPDIRIAPLKGKVLDLETVHFDEITSMPQIAMATPVLEETVFLQFGDEQNIVTLRGIDEAYLPNLGLDSHVIEGELGLKYRGQEAAIVGYGIADNLNLFVRDGVEPISVYAAKRDGVNSLNPQKKFIKRRVLPMSIVAINPEFDYTYLYTSRAFAQDLLEYESVASYIDITLVSDEDLDEVKDQLKADIGENYSIKSRIELNDVIFKTNATEKWVTFFILCFIMIVATFNMIGSLAMLIIEKRKDISLLRSLGSTIGDVQRLFLFEGFLITALGAAIGLGVGAVIILLQQYIGFFPLQGGIVEFYPVELEILDVLAVLGVSFSIGLGASFIPVSVLLSNKRLQTVVSN